MELEHSFLKAPFENLNRVFRNSQKQIEKEISLVVHSMNELEKKKSTVSKEETYKSLDKLVGRLNGLKRKLEDTCKEEELYIQRCKSRLNHLKSISEFDLQKNLSHVTVKRWNSMRLDRILVDYFLRNGYFETALQLTKDSELNEYVDLDIFLSAKKVIESLEAKSCKEALKWCAENRSRLKKMESSLEFNLHLQEFIELVRKEDFFGAISYARKNLAPCSETNMAEIQQAMATLAFVKSRTCERYKSLFAPEKWNMLIQQFKYDNYQLYSLSANPSLYVNLQAGLSALKTTYCDEEENTNMNCPVCMPQLHKLSASLPYAHHAHSCLVCRISGEIMNEDNPPMVLPNGYAYSKNALMEMAAKNNGKIVCPRTREIYKIEHLKRAFIC